MNCPACNSEMVKGDYVIQSSFLRFLVAGISWQALWFQALYGDSAPRVKVLDTFEAKGGYHCARCGAALLLKEQ